MNPLKGDNLDYIPLFHRRPTGFRLHAAIVFQTTVAVTGTKSVFRSAMAIRRLPLIFRFQTIPQSPPS